MRTTFSAGLLLALLLLSGIPGGLCGVRAALVESESECAHCEHGDHHHHHHHHHEDEPGHEEDEAPGCGCDSHELASALPLERWHCQPDVAMLEPAPFAPLLIVVGDASSLKRPRPEPPPPPPGSLGFALRGVYLI